VLGTLGNCAGGTTPWGTVLSGEENFNGYFDASGALDSRYATSYKRYGLAGDGRGWNEVDPRFDLTQEPHEPFRFGWIVELDPSDPGSTPRKHTMLGRFKHEGANVALSRSGKAVVYMGDDERGDYIYKFVSRDSHDPRRGASARRHNLTLLTAGTLYVARFTGDGASDGVHDGTGEWLPLTSDTTSFVPGMSVNDVLIDTRLAADKVGPTRMDRPEDIEPNPVNGKVYCALTNNSNRGSAYPTDEANPLATSQVRDTFGGPLRSASGNRNGYVLEISPRGGDHTSTAFGWDLMLVCGDPDAPETYFAGYPKQLVSPISCPDNVAFDAVGNLWVATDGAVLGSHDGLFRVPVSGPRRGHVQQFLTVPVGAETCGPLISEDQQSVFIAVQHPGETDGATFENQSSTWPHTDAFPRPAVVVVHRG
jgi:secreted PhoX family phosphatase